MKLITGQIKNISKNNYSLSLEGGDDNFYFVGSESERDMLKRMAESIISHYEMRLKLK